MKKHIQLTFILLLTAGLESMAAVTTPAEVPAYYSSLNGKSGANLWAAASSVAARNRKNIGYDGLYDAYKKTDSYPADSVGKAGLVWDIYSLCGFSHNQKKCGSYQKECDCYNREHSIPKSWFGGSTSGIGCDIFHVIPTDGKVNGMRSAFVYGEVKGSAEYTSKMGHKKGSGGAILNERKTICAAAGSSTSFSGTVFEPVDQYKGDLARGIMGTMLSWNRDMTQAEGSRFFQSSFTPNTNFGLTAYGVALLMKWHRQDPVSKKEIDRNNGIQATQGNRNPIIDYPYLAEYIWGEHAGETVDMSRLIASCDPAFVPGKSNGWRAQDVVPDKPGVKHAVTFVVNGEELRTDSITEGTKPASLPGDPVSCSVESNVFVGWTDMPIIDYSDIQPATLFSAPGDFPALSADLTVYAVFAHRESQGGEPATYSYGVNDQSDEWTNTAGKNNSYWVLRNGTYLESPLIDLSGLKKITARLRTYGGTNYCELNVKAGSTLITTIEATSGSTLTDYEWKNNKSLSGTSRLTFSSAVSTDKNGVAFSYITVDATGASMVTNRYITTCQKTTELVEPIINTHTARKILVGGQIYILIGDAVYTPMGQRVK